MDASHSELVETARFARERAYAPYSGYRVGAAVRDETGRIWSGCNVENASYGLSICAERAAVFAMVAGGGKAIRAVAVVTDDGSAPCGACRQVLSEFASGQGSVPVVCADASGKVKTLDLGDLLPLAFSLRSENRTAGGTEPV